ncbi:MAG: TIM44-like domain-containing protein [Nitrospirae bacterium]|nr:TIM44-like domain-containing protein [Nitrospirota bacterium]MDE3049900.1 TIM44-like domain-containing protein [Nitrospirota bacterium]MDE3220959.1 TIM44-like domain-containing protein [Nitrospirota bacterium]
MNTTKLIAATIVFSLIGVPTVSFAKARGGSGGGYSSGSRTSGSSGSIGSRGSRTYDQNGAQPIQQSATPKPATAPQPAAGSPTPTTQPTPATQPSFLQRNPLLAGIAGGIAGSWLGHMLFGATESSAKTNEAGEALGETGQAAGASSSAGILLILMLLGAGTLYYFLKVRRSPTPDFSGITRSSAVSGTLAADPSPTILRTATVDMEVTPADKTAFQQLLIDIQTAWSKQDLAGLRRCVTPEMLTYFSTALAENTSQEIENHVEDVVLLRAEVREAWTEGATQYATAELRWSARDYTVSLTKQHGEPGYLVEGSEETPSETSEVWTFMRFQNGKWLLSAIQQ